MPSLLLCLAGHSLRSMIAYRTQFWIELLGAGVRLATGVLSLTVIFGNVGTINGWSEASAGVVLGVFFIVTGLHGIVFGPSISALSGYDGAIVSGTLDFHLLRPRSTQVLVSVSRWAPLICVELIIGSVLVARALASLESELSAWQIVVFICSVFMSVSILYSLTLSLASLMFWKADFLFTWLLRPVVQMARFPADLYPGWLKLLLTWIVPVGVLTTVPAQILLHGISLPMLSAAGALAAGGLVATNLLFRAGLRRYASASS
ncbi:MAG: ABC-2 family transporter protein [Spirochaetaceae bacterium]|nr:ABC-2 family transporter protein [Spirochaetaceae bacterium]